MSLLEYFYNGAVKNLKKAIHKEIVAIMDEVTNGDGTTVKLSKDSICRVIQDQRKVPGTLRGMMCDSVKAINEQKLITWLYKLQNVVASW
jgi:hypothetical protein